MVDRGIGCLGSAQRLTRMALLPAARLARRLPQTATRAGFFSPSLDGGLSLLLLFIQRLCGFGVGAPVGAAMRSAGWHAASSAGSFGSQGTAHGGGHEGGGGHGGDHGGGGHGTNH
jgi:hypothetical protein